MVRVKQEFYFAEEIVRSKYSRNGRLSPTSSTSWLSSSKLLATNPTENKKQTEKDAIFFIPKY